MYRTHAPPQGMCGNVFGLSSCSQIRVQIVYEGSRRPAESLSLQVVRKVVKSAFGQAIFPEAPVCRGLSLTPPPSLTTDGTHSRPPLVDEVWRALCQTVNADIQDTDW